MAIPAAAVALSLRQDPLYQATAEVLLSRQDVAASLSGITGLSAEDPERFAETQTSVAELPDVARRAAAAARVDIGADEFLKASDVAPKANADVLTFAFRHANPDTAVRLATAYAEQFIAYRQRLDARPLEQARRELREQLAELLDRRQGGSELYANLLERESQLETLQTLQASNKYLVRGAREAEQIQPHTVRNGVLGLMLGMLLAMGLAVLRDALDTRVRSVDEIGHQLGLPLLARVPEPPRRMRRHNQLVMREAPQSSEAEAFRMLRTNLEFANFERGARSIMVTSALEDEGKSTTVANLAIAQARAGKRVVLVDIDLRRAGLSRFFQPNGQPGLTDVLLGRVELAEALIAVPDLDASRNGAKAQPSSNGGGGVAGLLELLPAGPLPPNAGEFAESRALGDVLAMLRGRADLVLIDAPPLLGVGDAVALSAQVDALVVVTRLNVVRRPILNELRRVLDHCPVSKLGFVLTGAHAGVGYGYDGYGRHYDTSREREFAG